jgi:hypothetical protein
MALADKLAAMASYANEVQDIMDKDVELLDFQKRQDQGGAEVMSANTKTGSAVQPHPSHVQTIGSGGWFFCHLVKEGGRLVGVPIAKFSPDLYFEAKPIERLWVEKTFEREQKKFQTEEGGDVIEWTPITREITIQPNGRVELGEFAQHFAGGRAFANVGKAKGEGAPLLGVAPSTSANSYKVEADALIVPRLDKIVRLSEPRSFPAEWNEQRKMLLVYLEGVTLPTKA